MYNKFKHANGHIPYDKIIFYEVLICLANKVFCLNCVYLGMNCGMITVDSLKLEGSLTEARHFIVFMLL